MTLKLPRLLNRWTLIALLVVFAGVIGIALVAVRSCARLTCVFPSGSATTQCGGENVQTIEKPASSDVQDLILEGVKVVRHPSSALISVRLKGKFWNETDQNLYIFVGSSTSDSSTVSYSLTADEQYLTDVAYAIRNTIQLPHSNDVRIGIMAPEAFAYTPQIYFSDKVEADLVGHDAHIQTRINGNEVQFLLPLDEYYERKKTAVPDRLSFTVSTARDYVGFIDQISVLDVASGEAKEANDKLQSPAVYPLLNYDSHAIKNVTLTQPNNGPLRIELETAAAINDWAQTNLNFFFVPVPNQDRGPLPDDPSQSFILPARWSYYCAVYSPHRLFCKASNGADFSYDTGYAKRSSLEQPRGVSFQELGGTKNALELTPEVVQAIKNGADSFALIVTVGRDGFGPTSCFGCKCIGRCNLVRRLENLVR